MVADLLRVWHSGTSYNHICSVEPMCILYLIHHSLGPSLSQMAAQLVSCFCMADTTFYPHIILCQPIPKEKLFLAKVAMETSRPPSNTWSLGPTWAIIPNGISIELAIFPLYTLVTNRETDGPPERRQNSIGIKRPLMLYVCSYYHTHRPVPLAVEQIFQSVCHEREIYQGTLPPAQFITSINEQMQYTT